MLNLNTIEAARQKARLRLQCRRSDFAGMPPNENVGRVCAASSELKRLTLEILWLDRLEDCIVNVKSYTPVITRVVQLSREPNMPVTVRDIVDRLITDAVEELKEQITVPF